MKLPLLSMLFSSSRSELWLVKPARTQRIRPLAETIGRLAELDSLRSRKVDEFSKARA